MLYQNELPYDPPSQAEWTRPDGTLGWAGYKVGDDVQRHQFYGGGVYVYNRNAESVITQRGFEVPERPGVRLHHLLTVDLSGPGIVEHVLLNDTGSRRSAPPRACRATWWTSRPPEPGSLHQPAPQQRPVLLQQQDGTQRDLDLGAGGDAYGVAAGQRRHDRPAELVDDARGEQVGEQRRPALAQLLASSRARPAWP